MLDDFDNIAKKYGVKMPTAPQPPRDSKAEALNRAAQKLGIQDPVDLGAIISFETGGTYDPHKVGGEGNKYKGLIQFGPEEQKKYYKPNDTFETQVEDGVVRYFQDRFKQAGKSTRGATLEDLYTTVIAGNPNANRDAKDSFGTSARSGTQRILKEHRPKVLQKFFGGQAVNIPQLDVDYDALSAKYIGNVSATDFDALSEKYLGATRPDTTVPPNTFLKPDEPLATDAPTQDFSFLAEDVQPPSIPTELKDREALQPVDTTAIDAMMRAPQRGQMQQPIVKVPTRTVQRPTKGKPAQQAVQQSAPTTAAFETFNVPLTKDSNEYSVNQEVANQIASKYGFDIDVVKQVLESEPVKFKSSTGDDISVNDYIKYQARTSKLHQREVGASVIEKIRERATARKANEETLKIAREKVLSENTGLDTNPEMLDILAAKEAGFIGKYEAERRLGKSRDEYIDWLVAKGYAREDAVERAFGVKKEDGKPMSAFDWALAKNPLANLISGERKEDTYKTVRKNILDDIEQYGSLANATKAYKQQEEERKLSVLGQPTEALKTAARYITKIPSTIADTVAMATDLDPVTIGYEYVTGNETGVRKGLLDVSEQWRNAVDKDLALMQNPAYKSDFVANELAEGLAQFAVQMVGAPLTGGASLALPLMEGSTAQYREANKAGADRATRITASAVGAMLAVPDVLLKAKYLKSLTGTGKLKFIENLTGGLFTKLAKKFGEKEAREITKDTVGAFIKKLASNTSLGFVGEYSQERLEDVGNKALAKATYKPELTWEEVILPSAQEKRGYLAAGIAGLFGGTVETAIEKLSNAELKRGDTELAKMLANERISQTNYERAKVALKKEIETRVKRGTYFAKDAQIQAEAAGAEAIENFINEPTAESPKTVVEPTAEPTVETPVETERKVDPKRKSVFDEVFGEEEVENPVLKSLGTQDETKTVAEQESLPVEKPKKKIKPTVTTEVTEESVKVEPPVEQPVEKVVEKPTPKAELIAERDEKIAEIEADAKELEATGKVIEARNLRQTITPLRMEYKKKLTSIGKAPESKLTPPQVKAIAPNVIEKGQNIITKQPSVDSVNISDLPDGTKVTYTKADGTVVNGTMATDKFGRVVSIGDTTRSVKLPWKPVDEPMMMAVPQNKQGTILNDKGQPLEVLHGTVDENLEFKDRERGIFFTSSAKLAETYTQSTFFRGGRGKGIVKANIRMSNPLVIDAMGTRNDNIPVPWQEWKPKVFGNLPSNAINLEGLFKYAVEKGHDGVIVRNVIDDADVKGRVKGDVYAVKSTDQIDRLDREMFKRPVEGSPEFVKATELANLPKRGETFLKGVESTAKDGFIDLSPEAVEMGRVIDKAVGRSEGIRYGTTYTKADAIDHIEGAKDLRQVLKDKGMSTKAIDKYIADFEKVAKENQGIVPVGIEASRKHETLHGADLKSRIVNGETITTTKESDAVVKNPTFKKFHDKLNEIVGKKLSTESAMAEAVAYLGDGDYKQFGLTIKEAASVLADIGIARFNSLVEAYDGDVEKAKANMAAFNIEGGEKIYEAIKSTDNGKGVRPSTESSQKRESKSETTGSEDVGNAEEAGQGKATTEESDGVKFKPSGSIKLSNTPKSINKTEISMDERPYTSVTNPAQAEFAGSILDQGIDAATKWFNDQVGTGQHNAGATTAVGLSLMMHHGLRGDTKMLNKTADALVPYLTEAGQAIQAMAILNMLSPKYAAAYATKLKKQKTGKDITDVERRKATSLAERQTEATKIDAAVTALEKAYEKELAEMQAERDAYEAEIEALTTENSDLQLDLKAAQKKIKAERNKGKAADSEAPTKRQVAKMLADINNRISDIDATLNEAFKPRGDVMMMAVKTPINPEVKKALIDWATFELNRDLHTVRDDGTIISEGEFYNKINEKTNGSLSAEEIQEIHSTAALRLIEPRQTTLQKMQERAKGENPPTAEEWEKVYKTIAQAEARKAHLKTAKKTRNQYVKEVNQIVKGLAKDNLAPEKAVNSIIRIGVEEGFSDAAIYHALLRRKMNQRDSEVELHKEYPGVPVRQTMADATRLTKKAKLDAQIQAEQAKSGFELTEQDLKNVREEKRVNNAIKRHLTNEQNAFYDGLVKSNLQIGAETLGNYRKAGLLLGFITHLRNLVGNTTFNAAEETSVRPIAAMADIIASKATGQRKIQGISAMSIAQGFKNLVASDPTLKSIDAPTGIQKAWSILWYGDTMEEQHKMQYHESHLRDKADKEGGKIAPKLTGGKLKGTAGYYMGSVADAYINMSFRLLSAEDALYKVYAFRRSLEEQAVSIAKTEANEKQLPYRLFKGDRSKFVAERRAELLASPTAVMQIEAAQFADDMTFQNANPISDLIAAAKNKHYAVKVTTEIPLPFDRTPTNIVLRLLEYTPLGYVKAGVDVAMGIKKPRKTMQKFSTKYRQAVESDLKNGEDFNKLTPAEQREAIRKGVEKLFTGQQQQRFARAVGRATTGTAMTLPLGFSLAAMGLLTGIMSGDDEDKLEKGEFFGRLKVGIENASLLIPGVGRFRLGDDPYSKSIVLGATMYEQMALAQRQRKDAVSAVSDGVSESLVDAMFEQPLLRETKDLIKKDTVTGEVVGGLGRTLVPFSNLMGSVSEIGDSKDRRTTTFSKKDRRGKSWFEIQDEGLKNAFTGRLPILRNYFATESKFRNPELRGNAMRRTIRAFDLFNSRPPKVDDSLTWNTGRKLRKAAEEDMDQFIPTKELQKALDNLYKQEKSDPQK